MYDSPIYGLIFLFKYPTGESKQSEHAGPLDGEWDFEASDAGVWFANQTIQNACGTQALLSVLFNKDGMGEVDIGEQLRGFKDFTGAFPAEVWQVQIV